jgi:1-acyl-sn-glycerol-3-phosphate acyltransferase
MNRIVQWARCALRWSYGCYAWIVFGVIVMLFGSLILLLRRPRYGRQVARMAARIAFRCAGMPFRADGLDRLPQQPHILLVNHTSFLDAIALTALLPARPGYAFAVRQQYRRQRVFCPLLRSLGVLVLQPALPAHHHANIAHMAAALQNGECLIVFPEGRIQPEAGLNPFHSGAFIAAAIANVPIAVAGLTGAREALRLKTWLPHRASVELKIGPAIAPPGIDMQAVEKSARAAREAMLPLTGEQDAAAPVS